MLTNEKMLQAKALLDETKSHNVKGLADLMMRGIDVMPSPYLQNGKRILMVSQADYDAMIEYIDTSTNEGPSDG